MKTEMLFVAMMWNLAYLQGIEGAERISLAFEYFSLRGTGSINVLICPKYDAKAVLRARTFDVSSPCLMNLKTSNSIAKGELKYLLLGPALVTGVIVDLDCRSSWGVLLDLIPQVTLYNATYAFAFITEKSVDHVVPLLDSLGIRYDSDVVVVSERKIYDFHRASFARPLVRSQIGRWTEEGKLLLTPKPRRADLQGITLRGTTITQFLRPEVFQTPDYYDHNFHTWRDVMGRFSTREHKWIEQMMNFKTNINYVYDWGYYNASLSWHGFGNGTMFGMLGNNETDLGIVLSWMWSKRMSTVYFAPPTHLFKAPALFRHPPAGISYDAFARPFVWTTWLVVWGFVVLGSICIYVGSQLVENGPGARMELTLAKCFTSVIGILSLERTLDTLEKSSTRSIALVLQVLALMVYSYYGAMILGFLLTPSPRTITTLDKLLASGMQFWMENSSSNYGLIKSNLSLLAIKYFDTVIKGTTPDQDRVVDRIDGLKLVQRGGHVLYGLTPNLFKNIRDTFSSAEICSLHYILLLYFHGSTAIQRFSPYKEMYTKATLWMLENGLNDFEEQHWYSSKPECYGSESNPAVRLEATFVAHFIFAIGVILSLILLLLEKWQNSFIEKRNKKKKLFDGGRLLRKKVRQRTVLLQ